MAALIPIFLQYLPSLLSAGKSVEAYIADVISAAKQSNEWTDEHDAQFRQALIDAGKSPEWQPDPK